MTPAPKIHAALRGLAPAECKKIIQAIRQHPDPEPIHAYALLETDAVVWPLAADDEQGAREAAFAGVEFAIAALLGEPIAHYVWAEFIGNSETRTPKRFRPRVALAVAKLRRAVTQGGRR